MGGLAQAGFGLVFCGAIALGMVCPASSATDWKSLGPIPLNTLAQDLSEYMGARVHPYDWIAVISSVRLQAESARRDGDQDFWRKEQRRLAQEVAPLLRAGYSGQLSLEDAARLGEALRRVIVAAFLENESSWVSYLLEKDRYHSRLEGISESKVDLLIQMMAGTSAGVFTTILYGALVGEATQAVSASVIGVSTALGLGWGGMRAWRHANRRSVRKLWIALEKEVRLSESVFWTRVLEIEPALSTPVSDVRARALKVVGSHLCVDLLRS